jgi:hypothetical protein
MELCQLLLEASRQGHIFKLCQSIFTFLGEASREIAYEMLVAKMLLKPLELYSALNETEAGKAGNQIKVRIGCRYASGRSQKRLYELYHSVSLSRAIPGNRQRRRQPVARCRACAVSR